MPPLLFPQKHGYYQAGIIAMFIIMLLGLLMSCLTLCCFKLAPAVYAAHIEAPWHHLQR